MAYASSPLWFLSLVLGVFVAAEGHAGAHPVITSGILYAGIMAVLLLPKFLGATLFRRSPEKLKVCGSPAKVVLGVAAETLYSMLLAPILMLFYTRFVLATLCGFKVGWGQQTRSDDKGPSWGAWIAVHGSNTVFILAATILVAKLAPSLLLWLLPVLIGPLLAIPFSHFSASRALGQRTRANGWFLTPEEADPPAALEKMDEPLILPPHPFFRAREYASDYGLLQAILDPYVNAIHVSLLRQRTEAGRTREYMALLADRLILDGPFTLTPGEKRTLVCDADAMLAMHKKLWSSPPSHLHEWWQAAFRNYVEARALSIRRTVNV